MKKNADPQDVVIVLGVYVLLISIIVFCTGLLFGQIKCQSRLNTRIKLNCKTVVGEMGYSKCYRTGRKYR